MPCVVKAVTDLKMKLKSCTLACFHMVVKVYRGYCTKEVC